MKFREDVEVNSGCVTARWIGWGKLLDNGHDEKYTLDYWPCWDKPC